MKVYKANIDNMNKVYPTQVPIINYSDILFVYKFREGEIRHHAVNDHTLVYVYSGEMTIDNEGNTTKLYAGDCVFLSRNHKVKISARPYNGIELKSVFLTFTRSFLIRYCHQMDKSLLPSAKDKRMPNVVSLEKDLHIESLFQSLSTFFIAWEKPTKQYMELKETEGIEALLSINPRFCINLFDFIGPWKISIHDFMEHNFTENLTVEEMARFTGRSVATFKRDFKQMSSRTPQRWITYRRLEEAYRLLSEGKAPNEIYLSLGFKSLSHFSTAFKRQYDKSPNELLNKPC